MGVSTIPPLGRVFEVKSSKIPCIPRTGGSGANNWQVHYCIAGNFCWYKFLYICRPVARLIERGVHVKKIYVDQWTYKIQPNAFLIEYVILTLTWLVTVLKPLCILLLTLVYEFQSERRYMHPPVHPQGCIQGVLRVLEHPPQPQAS